MNRRLALFELPFLAGLRTSVVDEVLSRISSREQVFVLTVNVDTLVRLSRKPVDDQFRSACLRADVVVADGMPIVWASRLLRRPLPERVPGVDLMLDLCAAAERNGLTIFLLGAGSAVAARAANKLHTRFPGLTIKGCYSPPIGFETDVRELAHALKVINTESPDLLFVALGQPKAEKWIAEVRSDLRVRMIMGIGGAFDMVAGKFVRAPAFVRRVGFEWLWRLGQEPLRLGKRYVIDAVFFPIIVWREWRRLRHAENQLRSGGHHDLFLH